MDSNTGHASGAMGRRRFLAGLSAAACMGLATPSGSETLTAPEATQPAAMLPQISLGPHQVTRLVAGWNPIGGYSYLGHHMDRHMKEYFTVEQTVEFLLNCERAGINTHQFSMSETTQAAIRAARERGSGMQFFGLHSGREEVPAVLEKTEPFALVHHGGVTDRLFADGKASEVHDYVKAVHDCGILAGVSAHNPDCIAQIASEGWEADFFMCCFYYLTRKTGSPSSTNGPPTLPVGYHFYAADPSRMMEVMRQVSQPCLGFKILGAGRKCGSQELVREAFKEAFGGIKPTDGVIVGMYPRFFDEIEANAGYTREFGVPA